MGWVDFISMGRVRSLIDGFQPGLVQNDWPVTVYNATESGDNPSKNVDTPASERKIPLGGMAPNCPGQRWWVWWQF